MSRSLAICGVLAGVLFALGLAGSACTDLLQNPPATPTASPRPTFTPSSADSAGCESCHGDKEKLKAVAAAEKETGQAACVG